MSVDRSISDRPGPPPEHWVWKEHDRRKRLLLVLFFAWLGLHFPVLPIIALLTIFAAGAAMFTATAQVYFRDLANFLPYFTRIWLYTSPILFRV